MAKSLFAVVSSSTGNIRTGTLSLDAGDGASSVQRISTPPGGDGDNFVYFSITFSEDLTDAGISVWADTLTQPGGLAAQPSGSDLIIGSTTAYPVVRVLVRF
jgi:hypothetical protein